MFKKSEPIQSKKPNVMLPKDIKNSETNADAEKDTAIFVSIVGSQYYVGNEPFPLETLAEKITRLREKTPDAPIFFNVDFNADYGDVVNALDALRKKDLQAASFFVEANGKNSNVIKTLIPKEPSEMDPILTAAQKSKLINVNLTREGKMQLNEKAVSAEALDAQIKTILKTNEEKGVFREGTNDIYKEATVKPARSARFGDVIKLVDQLKGAGATPIYLQLDDLSM
jgi:biopolymer transport protein ExbD